MVVKVQIPLFTNAQKPMALVYDKARSFESFMDVTDDLLEIMDGEPKKYFKAKKTGKSIELIKEVKNPGW